MSTPADGSSSRTWHEPATTGADAFEPQPLSGHTTYGDFVNGVAEVGPEVTASELEALLNVAPQGATVRLSAGDYTLDDAIIVTRSDVSLVGAGSDETRITFTDAALAKNPAHGFLFQGIGTSSIGSLRADAEEGQRTLTLENSHRLQIGDTVRIWQENDPAFLAEIGNDTWQGTTPLRTSMARVTGIDNDTVSFDRGVHFDFAAGAARVQRVNAIDNVSLEGLSIDYPLGTPDPGVFSNVLPQLERYRAVEFKHTIGAQLSDVQVNNSPSLAFELNRSLDISADHLRAQGAFNKGPGGNGYAFELRESYDSTYTHLADSGMRHSLLFASNWSSVGNQAHLTFTDRDINLHGGRDHDNVVQVEQSIRDPLTDFMSPTLWINLGGQAFGAPTDPDANLVTFEYAIGSRRNDYIPGADNETYLDGALGNDTLIAGSDDDLLRGGLGNDTLDGGPGNDTALFEGPFDSYRINFLDDGWVLFDGRSDDGLLINIERAVFADGQVFDLQTEQLIEEEIAPPPPDSVVEEGSVTFPSADTDTETPVPSTSVAAGVGHAAAAALIAQDLPTLGSGGFEADTQETLPNDAGEMDMALGLLGINLLTAQDVIT